MKYALWKRGYHQDKSEKGMKGERVLKYFMMESIKIQKKEYLYGQILRSKREHQMEVEWVSSQ